MKKTIDLHGTKVELTAADCPECKKTFYTLKPKADHPYCSILCEAISKQMKYRKWDNHGIVGH